MTVWWPCLIARITTRPVVGDGTIEQLDEAGGDLSAAVPTIIDQQRGLESLSKELTHQFSLAIDAGVGHIDVTNLAAGKFVDELTFGFDPIAIVQRVFAGDGVDHDLFRRVIHHRLLGDGEHHALARKSDERRPRVNARINGFAVDCEEIVALAHAESLRREWAARIAIECAATDKTCQFPGVCDGSVGVDRRSKVHAEHAHGARRNFFDIALALQIRVTDVEFGNHFRDKEVEILARDHRRKHRFVLGANRDPIDAVHSGVIEVITHDAPRIGENLGALVTWMNFNQHRRSHHGLSRSTR